MTKFSDRLKELRKSKDLSQADFSKQIGLSKSSINMYERGEREPGINTLEAIADYFNVDMDYLLGKTDHRNKYEWLIKEKEPAEKTFSEFQLKALELFDLVPEESQPFVLSMIEAAVKNLK